MIDQNRSRTKDKKPCKDLASWALAMAASRIEMTLSPIQLQWAGFEKWGEVGLQMDPFTTVCRRPCVHPYLFSYSLGTMSTHLMFYTLKNAAFATAGKDGKTLKDILDSATTPKVFFDVCNDWDALFAHFSIALQSIQDIQLMKNASCSGHTSGKGFP